jgi:cyclopentanol dehydrogenase
MAGRLEGKVGLITGAARGQGAAEAELFVREGARLVITDVLDEPLQKLADELSSGGYEVEALRLDVQEEEIIGATRLPPPRVASVDSTS